METKAKSLRSGKSLKHTGTQEVTTWGGWPGSQRGEEPPQGRRAKLSSPQSEHWDAPQLKVETSERVQLSVARAHKGK